MKTKPRRSIKTNNKKRSKSGHMTTRQNSVQYEFSAGQKDVWEYLMETMTITDFQKGPVS